MIYATGDTHGEFERFTPENFPEQASMSREDYVIVCGDFGGVWCGSKREKARLDWLEQLPFTLLFVSGNHENFDALARYPVEEWHGGKVQFIRPHIIHLMRGQSFELCGKTFFTMGGAQSHDIQDGILDPYSEDYRETLCLMQRSGMQFRVNHRSWWRQELPSSAEYDEALATLDRIGWKTDFVITHCAPSRIQLEISDLYQADRLTDFFETIRSKLDFRYWLFGHYHDNHIFEDRYVLLFEQIVRIV